MKIDLSVLRALEREKDLSFQVLVEILEQAIISAYVQHTQCQLNLDCLEIELDHKTGQATIYRLEKNEEGEVVSRLPDEPEGFGRIAAQAAKRVITSKMREFGEDALYMKFRQKQYQVVTGTVQQSYSSALVKVDLGEVEGVLRPEEQIPNETYKHGQRLRVFITEVLNAPRGVVVNLSRTHPGLVKGLFYREVPEIAEGLVEIVEVVREPGHRSKIAVKSLSENLSAEGACIGEFGRRVRAVMAELGSEKIDIIGYSPDLAQFVARALSPAQATRALVLSSAEKIVRVYVPGDSLALAIGKEGQNARLAARLTGAKIDIREELEEEV